MDFVLKQKVSIIQFAYIEHRANMHYTLALRQTTLYECARYN